MFYKKILPKQVLNLYATEFICEFSLILGDFSSRKFEIEFYDEQGNPLLSRKGVISGLPINMKLIENINPHNYSSQDAIEMFDAQEKIIFDEIKNTFELTYYDDTFERINKKFSYITYFNINSDNIGKLIPLN